MNPALLHRPAARRSSPATSSTAWATACVRSRSRPAPPTGRIEKTKRYVHDALVEQASRCWRRCCAGRREFARRSSCDWTRPAPRVSIIGEFWAMTTEGDGNYQLQRFLEGEGAECDIQFVTNWLLFMLWEGRYDTKLRAELRGVDERPQGPQGRQDRQEAGRPVRGRPGHPRRVPHLRRAPSATAATTCPTWTRSPRSRTSTTTTTCAAAKGTWRWASSSSTCCTTRRT